MKTFVPVLVLAAAAGSASAQTIYNTSVTPGFFVGSGIPNANFVVNNNAAFEAQSGLVAFYRFGVRAPGDFALRDYLTDSSPGAANLHGFRPGESFTDGTATAIAPGTAAWNFAFSVNLDTDPSASNGRNLFNSTVLLTIDWDPTAGINQRTYNLSSVAVALGGGSLTLFQDSQNLGFSFWNDPAFLALAGTTPHGVFDPDATGSYRIQLDVIDNFSSIQTTSVEMFVNVPTPGAAALLGLGGLAALRRRRN